MKKKILLAILIYVMAISGTISFGEDYNFTDAQKGTLNVQMYDVSGLPTTSNTNYWQNKTMIFSKTLGEPVIKSALEKSNADPANYNYIFYKPYAQSMGAGSKTAQKIWGYFVPKETGSYKFRTTSDDGQYFKIFDFDMFSFIGRYYGNWTYFVDAVHGNWNNGWHNGWNEWSWGNEVWNNGNGNGWGWGRNKTIWSQWDYFYNYGTLLANKMTVSANNVSTSPQVYLYKGEAYPVYLEYFNWGGQGKFQLELSINNGNYASLDYNQFYSGTGAPSITFNSLTGNNKDGTLKLDWDTVSGATSYKIVYSNSENGEFSLVNTVNTNSFSLDIANENKYNNKFFKIIAIVNGKEVSSNSIYLSGNVNFNSLSGKFSGNSYILDWNDIPAAEKYKLVYGTSLVNAITDIPNADNISPEITEFTIANSQTYLSKYIRAKVLIKGIYYYSNGIVVEDSGSGIDITEEGSLIKYHAYDNFNNNDLDLSVWDSSGSEKFEELNGIVSGSGIAKLKLKGNYNDFESYKISIDLLIHPRGWSDGGIGSTDKNGKNWISRITEAEGWVKTHFYDIYNGVSTENSATYQKAQNDNGFYDYRYVLSAEKNNLGKYDLKLDVYNITDGDEDFLYTWNIPSSIVDFDFREIFIGNGYNKNKDYFKMDNFDFVGYKMKSFDNLVGENINGDYKITWEPVAGAVSYKILYGTSPNLQGTLAYDLPLSPTEYTITSNQIAALSLSGKSIKVVAVLSDSEVSSNEIKIAEESEFNSLNGAFVGNNFGLSWNAFPGAIGYTILYGENDNVNNILAGGENVSASTLSYLIENVDIQNPYYNKLIRLKTLKNGIYYYSNKVVLSKFESLYGEKINGSYILNWQPVIGANSYKILYGEDEGNMNSSLVDNLAIDVFQYEITAAKIEELGLAGKMFKVVAVFDDSELDSNIIKFDENFEIGDLTGSLSGTDYNLNWTKFDGAESFVVLYGDADYISNIVEGAGSLSGNSKSYTITNVTPESPYYGKYLRIVAIKDGLSYFSNTVKIQSFDSLKAESFDDIYRLYWDKIEGATGYKVLYGPDADNITTEIADLGGTVGEFLINNRTGENTDLLDKYFKVVAIFDDSEMTSNSLFLQSVPNFATLEGSYTGNDFILNWTTVAGIDGLSILYGEEDNVNEVVVAGLPLGSTTYTISGITESSPYFGKFVRLKATKNDVVFYSNAVLIEDIDFGGEIEVVNGKGEFKDEKLIIKYGTEFEIGYKYIVTDVMHNPFFHFDLQGNEYLTYEKILSKVYHVVNGNRVLLSSKVVFDQDVSSINFGVNIYPKLDNNRFDVGEYIVLIEGKIAVRDGVDILQYLPANTPSWKIPYLIQNLEIDGVNIRTGLYIENFVYWNSTNKLPISDIVRDKNKRVFRADVEISDKLYLPPSL